MQERTWIDGRASRQIDRQKNCQPERQMARQRQESAAVTIMLFQASVSVVAKMEIKEGLSDHPRGICQNILAFQASLIFGLLWSYFSDHTSAFEAFPAVVATILQPFRPSKKENDRNYHSFPRPLFLPAFLLGSSLFKRLCQRVQYSRWVFVREEGNPVNSATESWIYTRAVRSEAHRPC